MFSRTCMWSHALHSSVATNVFLLRDVGSKRGSISSIIDLTTDWSVSINIRSPKLKLRTETKWICLSWIPWDQNAESIDPSQWNIKPRTRIGWNLQRVPTRNNLGSMAWAVERSDRYCSESMWPHQCNRVEGPTPDKPGWVGWELWTQKINLEPKWRSIDPPFGTAPDRDKLNSAWGWTPSITSDQ